MKTIKIRILLKLRIYKQWLYKKIMKLKNFKNNMINKPN